MIKTSSRSGTPAYVGHGFDRPLRADRCVSRALSGMGPSRSALHLTLRLSGPCAPPGPVRGTPAAPILSRAKHAMRSMRWVVPGMTKSVSFLSRRGARDHPTLGQPRPADKLSIPERMHRKPGFLGNVSVSSLACHAPLRRRLRVVNGQSAAWCLSGPIGTPSDSAKNARPADKLAASIGCLKSGPAGPQQEAPSPMRRMFVAMLCRFSCPRRVNHRGEFARLGRFGSRSQNRCNYVSEPHSRACAPEGISAHRSAPSASGEPFPAMASSFMSDIILFFVERRSRECCLLISP